jgi:hypothetical protein
MFKAQTLLIRGGTPPEPTASVSGLLPFIIGAGLLGQ